MERTSFLAFFQQVFSSSIRLRHVRGEVGSRVLVEEGVTDITDFSWSLLGPARHVLGHALGAEDAPAMPAMVLLLVDRQRDLATLTIVHVIFVLPTNLERILKHYIIEIKCTF